MATERFVPKQSLPDCCKRNRPLFSTTPWCRSCVGVEKSQSASSLKEREWRLSNQGTGNRWHGQSRVLSVPTQTEIPETGGMQSVDGMQWWVWDLACVGTGSGGLQAPTTAFCPEPNATFQQHPQGPKGGPGTAYPRNLGRCQHRVPASQ